MAFTLRHARLPKGHGLSTIPSAPYKEPPATQSSASFEWSLCPSYG